MCVVQADFERSRDEMRAARAATEAAESAPRQAPTEEVAVLCGSLRGTFLTGRIAVRDERSGREMPPGEFEKLAGKGASKKWKVRARGRARARRLAPQEDTVPSYHTISCHTMIWNGAKRGRCVID